MNIFKRYSRFLDLPGKIPYPSRLIDGNTTPAMFNIRSTITEILKNQNNPADLKNVLAPIPGFGFFTRLFARPINIIAERLDPIR